MSYLWGALAGLAWGSLAAIINGAVSSVCVRKNTNAAITFANAVRFVIYVGAIGLIFLARNILPFSFEAALIAAIAALSMLNIVISYRIARK